MKNLVFTLFSIFLCLSNSKATDLVTFQLTSPNSGIELNTDDVAIVELKAKNFTQVIGFQLAIHYPTERFTLDNVTHILGQQLPNVNFDYNATQEGIIYLMWVDNFSQGHDLPDNTTIFSLKLRAKEKTFLNEICIWDTPIFSEVTVNENNSSKFYIPIVSGLNCTATEQLSFYRSQVLHFDGTPISGLNVAATNNYGLKVTTDADGKFTLPVKVDIPFKLAFETLPVIQNYVDALDAFNLSEYILGVKQSPPNVPLNLVADLNLNASLPLKANQPLNGISTFDLVLLCKKLRGDNVNANFTGYFLDTLNITNNIFSYTQADSRILQIPPTQLDIYSNMPTIKYLQKGDVNLSLAKNIPIADLLKIKVPNQKLIAGKKYLIDFSISNDIKAYQLSLSYNDELVEVIESNDYKTDKPYQQINIVNYSSLFNKLAYQTQIEVRALKNVELKDVFKLSSKGLKNRAYNQKEELLALELEFQETIDTKEMTEEEWAIGEIRPNPAQNTIFIPITSTEVGEAELIFTDVVGQVIHKETQQLTTGSQLLSTSVAGFSQKGLLYCNIIFNNHKIVKKVIVF